MARIEWRRIAGPALIAVGVASSVATTPPTPQQQDAGAELWLEVRGVSEQIHLELTPEDTSVEVWGSVTLPAALTSALLLDRPRAFARIDLHGRDLIRPEDVRFRLGVGSAHAIDVLAMDAGSPLEVTEEKGRATVETDGSNWRSSVSFPPVPVNDCESGKPCVARFYLRFEGDPGLGMIAADGEVECTLSALFEEAEAANNALHTGIQITLDAAVARDPADGG